MTSTVAASSVSRAVMLRSLNSALASSTRSFTVLASSAQQLSSQQPQRQQRHSREGAAGIRSQSTWARAGRSTSESSRSRTSHHLRSKSQTPRRPIVNGKAIPFHVQDLANANPSTAAAPSSPSSSSWMAGRPTLESSNGDDDDDLMRSPIASPLSNEYDAFSPCMSPSFIQTPKEYESDLVVVLDLDECLVHATFINGIASQFAWQVQQRGRQDHVDAQAEGLVDTFKIDIPDVGMAIIHERPFVREFLKAVSQKYETHIYTAAMPEYAERVLKHLDPQQEMITKAWYRQSCDPDEDLGALVKNLNRLQTAQGAHCPRRTVLVDNNPLSFLANPQNGIIVPHFFNDPKDSTLPAVLELLQDLDANHKDVRPHLDQRFGIKAMLDQMAMEREATKAAEAPQLSFSQAAALF